MMLFKAVQIFLVCISAVAVMAQAFETWTEYVGADRNGNDLAGVTGIISAKLEHCQSICVANTACVAIEYWPLAGTNVPNCWPKNGLASLTSVSDGRNAYDLVSRT